MKKFNLQSVMAFRLKKKAKRQFERLAYKKSMRPAELLRQMIDEKLRNESH